MCSEDVTSLYNFQTDSFAPASVFLVDPGKGRLVAIVVFSTLGSYAGISGVRFVYSTGLDDMWGSSNDNAVSLGFFLSKEEYLIKVTVYKTGSLVRFLQASRVESLHRRRIINIIL